MRILAANKEEKALLEACLQFGLVFKKKKAEDLVHFKYHEAQD